VRLLGEVLGAGPDAQIFDRVARPFLERALQ
jgi:hypothetical protein